MATHSEKCLLFLLEPEATIKPTNLRYKQTHTIVNGQNSTVDYGETKEGVFKKFTSTRTFVIEKKYTQIKKSILKTMTEIVRGEASESDEEARFSLQSDRIYAFEVSGEATESDDDMYQKSVVYQEKCGNPITYNSSNLLRSKLVENNIAIWKDINFAVRQFISSTSKQLLNTEHILTKSQITLHSVLSSLKTGHTNFQYLHEKSSDVLTTNYLPKIKFP